MPIGIKDLIETKDMPTQMGSPAYAGSFPKRDSALVRALRVAGAIILGKTVTTALGFLDPGPTTNAFDPQRTLRRLHDRRRHDRRRGDVPRIRAGSARQPSRGRGGQRLEPALTQP